MAAVSMFVLNDVTTDSRVLREAATLASAGHRVTIVGRTTPPYAVAGERELRPDGVTILRVPVASGWLRWLLLTRQPRLFRAAVVTWATGLVRRGPLGTLWLLGAGAVVLLASPLLVLGVLATLALRWLAAAVPPVAAAWSALEWWLQWRLSVLPWARAASGAAPLPDIIHAHDLRALPAALARRADSPVPVIYDSHEIFVEAGRNALRPAWAKRGLRRVERRSAATIAALVTVNDELAALLATALRPPRVAVVRNCPPRWTVPVPPPDRLRQALGLAAGTSLVLYHGALVPGRGLAELAAAFREASLADAHLVYLGWGSSQAEVAALAAAPEVGGRLHLLPPVPPEELLPWVASADVVAVTIQPDTLNHRLSTPNKLWEALAAGVPVVASDFPAMRQIVLGDPLGPLGAVCDPTDPLAIAAALAALLGLPPAERAALRARCHQAAAERWNWETEGGRLVALYDDLLQGRPVEAALPSDAPVPQRATFLLPGDGAHDSRTRRLASDLLARGHLVTVLARERPVPLDASPWPAGTRVVRVATEPPGRPVAGVGDGPTAPAGRGADRLVIEGRRIIGVARRATRLARAAETVDDGADVYQAMGFLALPVGLRLAARAGARLVYDARDVYAESSNIVRLPWPVRRLFERRERSWARRADRVFTVNEACADLLATRLDVPRVAVVRNCPPRWTVPVPPPDRLRQALGLAAGTSLVLYHGALVPGRGLAELAAAFREASLADAHLVYLGWGSSQAEVAALAAAPEVGGRLHLLPPVPPEELLPWVASADVVAVTIQPDTLNHRLSTPNKLWEALAAGVPVVASDFPAMRQIVLGDPLGPLGAVCDPTDPLAIAAALAALLGLPPAERAALRARCHQAAAERWNWETEFGVVLLEYGQLTGRPW